MVFQMAEHLLPLYKLYSVMMNNLNEKTLNGLIASLKPFSSTITWRLPLTLFLSTLLFILGIRFLPYAGDGSHMAHLAQEGWYVTMHSVLTSIVHRLVYLIFEPIWQMMVDNDGFWLFHFLNIDEAIPGWYALAASSALAGAIAIQVLAMIRFHPLFLSINIFSGSFLVFMGEVENYAWVNLFLLLTFLAVERYLKGEWRLWPAMTFYFAAALFHGLAFFYFPPLLWIIIKKKEYSPFEFFIPFLGYISLYLLFNILLPHEGINITHERLVPFFHLSRKGHFFTFMTWEHLIIKAHFHRVASFLSIPIEWPLLLLMRKQINTDFKRYLLYCSLTGLAWHTIWHPDLGYLDWDLFSQIYIPLHVLLGILITERVRGH